MSIFSITRSIQKLKQVDNNPIATRPQAANSACDFLAKLNVHYHHITNPEEANEAIQTLTHYDGILGCDIETTPLQEWKGHPQAGLDPYLSRIRTIQFATDKEAFVFDLNHISIDSLHDVWEKPLVFHNAKFDVKFLLHTGINPKKVGCTLLMDLILRGGGGGKKLSELSKERLDLDISKDEQTSDWSGTLTPSQIAYAALDAVIAKLVCHKLLDDLKAREMLKITTIFNKAIPAISAMELAGIPFDWEAHQQLVLDWQQEFLTLEKEIQSELLIDDMSSSKEIQQKFSTYFTKQNYEVIRGKNGLPKLGKQELARYKDDPLIKKYLQYTCLKTRLATFGESLSNQANPVTKRIHPNFMHGRARTGRFATNKPNTQNFPNGPFREIIRPSGDNVFVVADFSQIELRLIAIVSQEENMLNAYRNSEDLHRLTASKILGILPEEVTKTERTCAKAVNFGFIYGQREGGFIKVAKNDYGLDISYKESQNYRNAFFQNYPAIAAWHKDIEAQVKATGSISTMNGWERDFNIEIQALIDKKQETLHKKKAAFKNLQQRIQSNEQILQNHREKSLKNPDNPRLHELLLKKEQQVKELKDRAQNLQRECWDLERRVNTAKRERHIALIPGLLDEYRNTLFSAYNLPIQGLGCELMATSLTEAYHQLQGTSARIINCIHDEIVVECNQSDAELVKRLLSEAMRGSFSQMFPDYHDTTQGLVDIKIAKNWGEAK